MDGGTPPSGFASRPAEDFVLGRGGAPASMTDSSGLIHPSGIVIGTSSKEPDATVSSISDSCEAYWNLRPEQLLGRRIVDLVQWPRLRRVRPEVERIGPIRGVDFAGTEWFVTLTYRFAQPMVHLEPVPAETDTPRDIDMTLWLATSIERLEYIGDPGELWFEGCENIRRITGFDRTVAIGFHDDGHGEVIAESLGEGAASVLGVHFPSLAVPTVTRLHGTPVRSISTDQAHPALVVPRSDPLGRPWDLVYSPLRSETMPGTVGDAMGAESSFILSLSNLEGPNFVIDSHSVSPRRLDALTRAAIELYARTLHARVDTITRAIEAQRHAEALALQRQIVDRVDTNQIASSLAAPQPAADCHEMLQLVAADAAIIRIGDECEVLGSLERAEVDAIEETVRVWLATLSRHGALMTDSVQRMHPRLAAAAPNVAGLLAASVGSQGDYLCWVRRPETAAVTWFDEASADRGFVPRVEKVTDRSAAWTLRDQRAAEALTREMEDTLLRRAQSELAQLALIDALTGLPNRRLLLDRVDKAISRAARGQHFTLLFIDLNDFKAINDRYGHQTGDEVLVETGRRLAAAVREGDTVARLAGDEFVVLCEDTRAGEEEQVAERIRASFSVPFRIGDDAHLVGLAIGVGHLELGLDAPSLLDRADRAMYRAKSAMKQG